jgi:hypothetical protein
VQEIIDNCVHLWAAVLVDSKAPQGCDVHRESVSSRNGTLPRGCRLAGDLDPAAVSWTPDLGIQRRRFQLAGTPQLSWSVGQMAGAIDDHASRRT